MIDILVNDDGEPKVLNWRIADKRSVARAARLGRSLVRLSVCLWRRSGATVQA